MCPEVCSLGIPTYLILIVLGLLWRISVAWLWRLIVILLWRRLLAIRMLSERLIDRRVTSRETRRAPDIRESLLGWVSVTVALMRLVILLSWVRHDVSNTKPMRDASKDTRPVGVRC